MRFLGIPDEGLRRIAQAIEPIFDFGGDVFGDSQYNGWIVAYDPATKQAMGYFDYAVYQDIYYINMIEVLPEHQGKGVAEALVNELIRRDEISYEDLRWGILTEEGAGLKEHLDERYREVG